MDMKLQQSNIKFQNVSYTVTREKGAYNNQAKILNSIHHKARPESDHWIHRKSVYFSLIDDDFIFHSAHKFKFWAIWMLAVSDPMQNAQTRSWTWTSQLFTNKINVKMISWVFFGSHRKHTIQQIIVAHAFQLTLLLSVMFISFARREYDWQNKID